MVNNKPQGLPPYVQYDEVEGVLHIQLSNEPIVKDVCCGWHVKIRFLEQGIAEIAILEAKAGRSGKSGRNGSNNKISRGHYFELMDRSHMASSQVQMGLGGQPALLNHPELMRLYQEAVDRLEDLYQAAGLPT